MKIKEVSGKKILVHCNLKLAVDCEDRTKDREAIQRIAERRNVKIILTTICKNCLKVLQTAED